MLLAISKLVINFWWGALLMTEEALQRFERARWRKGLKMHLKMDGKGTKEMGA
jgi:hypothetical protein